MSEWAGSHQRGRVWRCTLRGLAEIHSALCAHSFCWFWISETHKSPANIHWGMKERQIARRIGNRWRYERVDILSLGISSCGETSPTWGWGTKQWIYWVTLWYTSHRQIHMAHTVLGLLSCNHLTSQAVWWPSEIMCLSFKRQKRIHCNNILVRESKMEKAIVAFKLCFTINLY